MNGITLQQLKCFDAVATEGSFQAAADRLLRTHPTVVAAVRNLEVQLGFPLLDRSGYRVVLTERGRAFHARAQNLLRQADGLGTFGKQLAMGEETALRVVIGDLCPLEPTLQCLRNFSTDNPATRLDLYFEAISGPWERLADDEADLIFHHIDKSDPLFDYIDLSSVDLVPVIAAVVFPALLPEQITPTHLQDLVQCIIRDTARHSPPKDYYVLRGARYLTVSDQLMKKQVILNAMGWGHMPRFLVEEEIRQGLLIDFTNVDFKGGRVDLVAARRRDRPHGPAADRLWRYIAAHIGRWTP
ncbi:LysR family transcriptional regulator [Rhizobium mayense]|uniref:LysR family transcriptional regulator n=1 Tax=Rhizobium mayense TaxID=1312184 RepID=A0ABT7JPE6_9HYPH|nr:LysR family transcriptional regulator [Rhizobium mayense]MDL2398212.1 LysR family transcriptional regulator [Rhizobium mayense]